MRGYVFEIIGGVCLGGGLGSFVLKLVWANGRFVIRIVILILVLSGGRDFISQVKH